MLETVGPHIFAVQISRDGFRGAFAAATAWMTEAGPEAFAAGKDAFYGCFR